MVNTITTEAARHQGCDGKKSRNSRNTAIIDALVMSAIRAGKSIDFAVGRRQAMLTEDETLSYRTLKRIHECGVISVLEDALEGYRYQRDLMFTVRNMEEVCNG